MVTAYWYIRLSTTEAYTRTLLRIILNESFLLHTQNWQISSIIATDVLKFVHFELKKLSIGEFLVNRILLTHFEHFSSSMFMYNCYDNV